MRPTRAKPERRLQIQLTHERVTFVVRDRAAPPDAIVEVQQRRRGRLPPEEPVADEEQVQSRSWPRVRRETAPRKNGPRPGDAGGAGIGEPTGAAKALREVGMAAGPVEHAAEQAAFGDPQCPGRGRLAVGVTLEARADCSTLASGRPASGAASSSVKSVSSMRRPMLNGVVRVSWIRSEGVATPSRQKVSRSNAGSSRPAVVALADGGEELVRARTAGCAPRRSRR